MLSKDEITARSLRLSGRPPNRYTGTLNDPLQEAQSQYAGPGWAQFFGGLQKDEEDARLAGKNFRVGWSGFGNAIEEGGSVPRGRGPSLAAMSADDLNPLEQQAQKEFLRQRQADAAVERAKAEMADQKAYNDAEADRVNSRLAKSYDDFVLSSAFVPPSPIAKTEGVTPLADALRGQRIPNTYTARPSKAMTSDEMLLRSVPAEQKLGVEKTLQEMALRRQATESPAMREFRDAQSQGYTGTFQQYQDLDANRKKPASADAADNALIDRTATNILANPRDLTSIRQITSLRGDQRLKLYDALKAKDPKFNVGNIDRQIKFIDSYEDPKGRAAINRSSMNNILQHAADLSDVNQDYRRSNLRIINTPINILSQQGGTEWSKFATPLAVLKDEIGLYFAGGYAPTSDQQKTWDRIASDAATPAQIEQFAKDIIHVGLRRADTHNEQFKTMMGYDDPNLLTPAAVQAGERLGLGDAVKKYGSGGTIGAKPVSPDKSKDPLGIR